jgi:hypothetical protein
MPRLSSQIVRETRILKKEEIDEVRYIEHLGKDPYNKIYFFNQKPRVVSYSLVYWHSILGDDFVRINKKYLVRKSLIKRITDEGLILACGNVLKVTRRQCKRHYKEVAGLYEDTLLGEE